MMHGLVCNCARCKLLLHKYITQHKNIRKALMGLCRLCTFVMLVYSFTACMVISQDAHVPFAARLKS